MITWESPWFLAGVPVLILLFFVLKERASAGRQRHPKMKRWHAGKTGGTGKPPQLGSGLIGVVGLCFLLTALARPQWGQVEQKTFENARQVLIGMDLSRSMLGTDVSPSRLDRSKLMVETLLKELRGERVGLVVFAGTAFVQCPMSNDYEIMREMLQELNPNFLPEQGTNFAALLKTAYGAFDTKVASDKFLILLSDGEDVVGNWEPELERFVKAGIRIISLGVATAEGSILPDDQGGFIKDESGAVVLSRLDESVLRELAEKTGGLYVPATQWVDLQQVIEETVNQGAKGSFEEERQVAKIERFQIPLAVALLFLLLSLWSDFPVHPSHRKKPEQIPPPLPTRRRVPAGVSMILALMLPCVAMGAPEAGPAPQAPLPDLPATIRALAQKKKLSPQDAAVMAEETIQYGEAVLETKKPLIDGIIVDGLAAVDHGERLDPTVADWPELRRRLEELRRESEEQKEEQEQEQHQQDQQQQDQKDQQDQKKEDSKEDSKDQQGQSGGDPSDDKQSGGDSKENSEQKPSEPGESGEKDQQPSQPDSSEEKSEGSQGKDEESKDEPKEGQSKPEPGESDKKEEEGEGAGEKPDAKKDDSMQEVGGGSTGGQTLDKKDLPAELQELMGRLEQLKENDAPGKIHQIFAPEERPKEVKGKTW
jgi:Ca-activated chloride channel family protein